MRNYYLIREAHVPSWNKILLKPKNYEFYVPTIILIFHYLLFICIF